MALRQNMEHGPCDRAKCYKLARNEGGADARPSWRSSECSLLDRPVGLRLAAFAQAPALDPGRGGRGGRFACRPLRLGNHSMLTELKCGDSTYAMVQIWRASRTQTEMMPRACGGRVRD